uniref:Uncharacterized protein n=1 Tax=Vombatus ursinus TaxID=29139 RepID=A0A4X2KHF6_VOMUR
MRIGSAKSVQATLARPAPCNKGLEHVNRLLSSQSSILRTSIQVESSSQQSPSTMAEQQKVGPKDMEQLQGSYPPSPIFGIFQTPMKTSRVDPPNQLVKQLSEAFGAEASKPEHSTERVPPVKFSTQQGRVWLWVLHYTRTTRTPEHQKLPAFLRQTEVSQKQACTTEVTEQSPALRRTGQDPDKFLRGSETPCSSGSRPPRRKRAGKVIGRSPLTTLRDDNSPENVTEFRRMNQ